MKSTNWVLHKIDCMNLDLNHADLLPKNNKQEGPVDLTVDHLSFIAPFKVYNWEHSGSVVECLTRGAEGSSLTGVTELCL